MKNSSRGMLSLMLLLCVLKAQAQAPAIKFGEIKPEHFETKVYPIDSNANAVVLSDIGSSKYEADTKGGFNVIFKRHTRIRILNRNAFDIATVSIPMYASGQLEEKVENLEASTYNLENGTIRTTKLDKNSIFKDRLSKNYTVRKFTMPDLKEGCIVEIKYTFVSPYERDLRSWQFQERYPVLYSEYKLSVPAIYDFVMLKQGYHPYKTEKTTAQPESFTILGGNPYSRTEAFNFRTTVVTTVWAMENVPALKAENFTSNIGNHVAKIDFQLSRIQYPDQPAIPVMNNWMTVSEQLMKDPDFGETLTKGNNWMDDDIKKITEGSADKLEEARKIYNYVRDNFTCTNHNRYYLTNTLKKTFQSKTGSVADINLLLTAMLLSRGIDASPVLLSTRDHGKAYEVYPIMDRMNYVIAQATIDEKDYLLDASYSKLGFGKLSSDCYNGFARVINPAMPKLIQLTADSLKENKLTMVTIINDPKEGLKGSYTSTLGDDESYDLREGLAKSSPEEYFKAVKKGFGLEIEMESNSIDSLKLYEEPVAVKYDFRLKPDEDIIYLNPILSEGIRENPFKAAERTYPVEMPYAINETFLLKMEIPKGYKVDELPKSTRVKLNEDEGMFEYIVTSSNGYINLRSRLSLNKAEFVPEDYQTLRDFYAHVVRKHNEQIVLKKIK